MTDPNAAYGWNAQANYSNYGAPAAAQPGQQTAGYAAGNAAGKFIQWEAVVQYVLCITEVFGFLFTVLHSFNRYGSQRSVEYAIPATTTAAAASATGVGRPSCGTSGRCSTILAEFRRRHCRLGRRRHRQERWY